jgi:hypothetical protein
MTHCGEKPLCAEPTLLHVLPLWLFNIALRSLQRLRYGVRWHGFPERFAQFVLKIIGIETDVRSLYPGWPRCTVRTAAASLYLVVALAAVPLSLYPLSPYTGIDWQHVVVLLVLLFAGATT